MAGYQMKTSRKGKMALAVTEGVVNTFYLDSVGVPTIGIGHTKAAGAPDPIEWKGKIMPIEEILDLFTKDLIEYEDIVNRNVVAPLKQHEFDALVHFVYNVGEPNFKKSKLLKAINNGNFAWAGQNGFHGWLKPPELKGRRDKERAMFLNGYYGKTVAASYTANSAGRLKSLGVIDLQKVMT